MAVRLVTGDMTITETHPAEPGFGQLLERHHRELHVHCYRMLGSCTDAEDLGPPSVPRTAGQAGYPAERSMRATTGMTRVVLRW